MNKDLEAFAYSASHDLRAPLRQIHGFAEILLEDYGPQLDAGAGQLLTKVIGRSERMRHLIDDLLSFSRMGRQRLSRERVDLSALVQEVVRDAEPEARGREVWWHIAQLPVAGTGRCCGGPGQPRVERVGSPVHGRWPRRD
jgi:light-regulated signal transduction histidine kinase (bacteriophytochrome)